jgi:hypothetical protein
VTERQEIARRIVDAVELALACTRPQEGPTPLGHVVRALSLTPRKITKAEFWAELGTLSPSFRAIQHEEPPRRPPADSVKWKFKDGELNELKAEIASLAATGDERAVHLGREFKDVDDDRIDEMKAYPVVPEFEADDDELLRFHVEREAEEDRKRVCPALPSDELRRVLAELRKRDWTERDRWVRVESLRRWLGLSPAGLDCLARALGQ